jgi:hypothetical protein
LRAALAVLAAGWVQNAAGAEITPAPDWVVKGAASALLYPDIRIRQLALQYPFLGPIALGMRGTPYADAVTGQLLDDFPRVLNGAGTPSDKAAFVSESAAFFVQAAPPKFRQRVVEGLFAAGENKELFGYVRTDALAAIANLSFVDNDGILTSKALAMARAPVAATPSDRHPFDLSGPALVVAAALASPRDDAAVRSLLLATLQDPGSANRQYAAQGLGVMRKDDAATNQALLKIFSDPKEDAQLRIACADALAAGRDDPGSAIQNAALSILAGGPAGEVLPQVHALSNIEMFELASIQTIERSNLAYAAARLLASRETVANSAMFKKALMDDMAVGIKSAAQRWHQIGPAALGLRLLRKGNSDGIGDLLKSALGLGDRYGRAIVMLPGRAYNYEPMSGSLLLAAARLHVPDRDRWFEAKAIEIAGSRDNFDRANFPPVPHYGLLALVDLGRGDRNANPPTAFAATIDAKQRAAFAAAIADNRLDDLREGMALREFQPTLVDDAALQSAIGGLAVGSDHVLGRSAAALLFGFYKGPSLDVLYKLIDSSLLVRSRTPEFLTGFLILSGGQHRHLARLISDPGTVPLPKDEAERQAILSEFAASWPEGADNLDMQSVIAKQTVAIVDNACSMAPAVTVDASSLRNASLGNVLQGFFPAHCLTPASAALAANLRDKFRKPQPIQARDLDSLLSAGAGASLWFKIPAAVVELLLAHALFWIALIWLYPKSPTIQAMFFWSPKVRRYLGIYVTSLIPIIPFARRRLFQPFREQMGPPPDVLEAHNPKLPWFSQSEVVDAQSGERMTIDKVINSVRGLTVIEGASGLGKTTYLARLAADPKRLVAYIRAAEEGGDVLKALRKRMPADVVRDEDFLRILIYAGGLDICIDGLNEVSAEARERVRGFIQEITSASVLVATQPIRWSPPSGARVLRLQALRPDQTEAFLLDCKAAIEPGALIQGEAYAASVRTYLAQLANTPPVNEEDRLSRERALSNPMDLTTIATILSTGATPDLLNLVRTVYDLAARKFSLQNQNANFPLTAFAEYVYARRCEASGGDRELIELSDKKFLPACDALAEYRLLLRSEETDATGHVNPVWRFRHDKILDFFLYIALTEGQQQGERILMHLSDPRFRGVYLLLALRAPLDDAKQLRELLVDGAVETKDRVLSDEVWAIVRNRIQATIGAAPAVPAPPQVLH